MPAFVPWLDMGGTQLLRHAAMTAGKRAVVKFGKDVVVKNIHKYTGPAAKRKMFDTFMKTSEKVAGSKPAQTIAKNLEKVNPYIRKVAPDNAPVPNPTEWGVYKTVTRLLRGKAMKVGSQKMQALKDQMEQGTISENKANKLLRELEKNMNVLEKSKENPFM